MAPTAPTPAHAAPDSLLRSMTSFRLIKLGKLVSAAAEVALDPIGVKPRQYSVLATIASQESLSQQDMSRLLEIDPNVMVGVIDDLEQLGLAERQRNPRDRRRHVIVLTRAGRDALRRGLATQAAFEADVLSSLSPADREALAAITGRLLDALGSPPG